MPANRQRRAPKPWTALRSSCVRCALQVIQSEVVSVRQKVRISITSTNLISSVRPPACWRSGELVRFCHLHCSRRQTDWSWHRAADRSPQSAPPPPMTGSSPALTRHCISPSGRALSAASPYYSPSVLRPWSTAPAARRSSHCWAVSSC